MPVLLRRPVSAGARPCQGRSSLDRACAPAEYGSYRKARTGTISQIKVSTLRGEPRPVVSVLLSSLDPVTSTAEDVLFNRGYSSFKPVAVNVSQVEYRLAPGSFVVSVSSLLVFLSLLGDSVLTQYAAVTPFRRLIKTLFTV